MPLTETAAVARLSRNGVSVTEKLIGPGLYNSGLGVWAAVDCLVNYHGYILAPRPRKDETGSGKRSGR